GRHAIGHEVGQGDLPEIERLSVGQEIALAYQVEDGADDERYPERAADDAAVEHDLEQRRLCGAAAGGGAHAGYARFRHRARWHSSRSPCWPEACRTSLRPYAAPWRD